MNVIIGCKMVMSGFAGREVAMFDGTLSFESGFSDDCKHSEGFSTCWVQKAGRGRAGREQRCGICRCFSQH